MLYNKCLLPSQSNQLSTITERLSGSENFSCNLEFLCESLDVIVVGDVQPASGDALDAGELVELVGVEVGGDHGATLLHKLEGSRATNACIGIMTSLIIIPVDG